MPVASARKIKFFKAKETVEESSDEDSEPGPSKKPKTKVAEEEEEFEDMQRSDMTIVDLSCLQLLITASGVLCPLCEQSVSIISFLLSLCVYWVGRGGGGGSVFRSLGVSVYVCLGACLCFSRFCCSFFFWGGGGCTCVRAYMRVCVWVSKTHIYWFNATLTQPCEYNMYNTFSQWKWVCVSDCEGEWGWSKTAHGVCLSLGAAVRGLWQAVN